MKSLNLIALFLFAGITAAVGCEPASRSNNDALTRTEKQQQTANEGLAQAELNAATTANSKAQTENEGGVPATTNQPEPNSPPSQSGSSPLNLADSQPGSQTPEQNNATKQNNGRKDSATGFTSNILSWNVESEGNDPKVIASQLKAMVNGKYDIVGLTEVHPESFRIYGSALGDKFRWGQTISGFNDRMMILYNTDKYERIRRFELNEINFKNRYRSPLVVHLKEKKSGVEFLVMINHLARGKAEIRQQQAEQLVDWARNQNLPIVAIGDYNFDFVFATESGNEAFSLFLRDNIFRWVRPEELIDSNWFDPEPDGVDNYPGSILDFCFVAGSAKKWQATSRVIVREGDFPDNQNTSDHRPVDLIIQD